MSSFPNPYADAPTPHHLLVVILFGSKSSIVNVSMFAKGGLWWSRMGPGVLRKGENLGTGEPVYVGKGGERRERELEYTTDLRMKKQLRQRFYKPRKAKYTRK